VDLFKTPPTPKELAALCTKLGLPPRALLRTKDPAYDELGLASGRHTDAQLLALMAEHPGLIQRPIVVKGNKAIIGRPVETVVTLLD
jgi:arsenate reductase